MIEEKKFKQFVEENGLYPIESIAHLRSISRSIDIYEFHKAEAYAQIQNVEPTNNKEALMLVFAPNDDFFLKKLSIQAHVQAAIHNARALYDLLAQLLNKVLLNNKFSLRECSLYNVKYALNDSELKGYLIATTKSDSFKYVNAFVNVIKHRDLVILNPQIDFVENRAGIRFSSFEYEGKSYPSLWADEALQHTLNVKNEIISLGELLDRQLLPDFV